MRFHLRHTFYTERRNINSYDASTHRQTYTIYFYLVYNAYLQHGRGRPSSSCKINTKFIYIKLKNDIGSLKLYKYYNIKDCTLSNIYNSCQHRYVRSFIYRAVGAEFRASSGSRSHIVVMRYEAMHLLESVREPLLLRELVLLERHRQLLVVSVCVCIQLVQRTVRVKLFSVEARLLR